VVVGGRRERERGADEREESVGRKEELRRADPAFI
jgi:hypothetical protein